MRRAALLTPLAAAMLGAAAHAADAPVRESAYAFASRIDVIAAHPDRDAAERAIGEIFTEMRRLDWDYHAWNDSALTRANAAVAAGSLPHPVSAELELLIRLSAEANSLTNGLFDPSLGKLFAMWGFHSDEPSGRKAPLEEIDALLRDPPSMGSIAVREGRIERAHPDAQLDFGAMLKGYSLDLARETCARGGIRNVLLDFGSTLLALGRPEEGRPWTVAVREGRQSPVVAEVRLAHGEAIGASGSAEINYVDEDGSTVSHVFSPRTGRSAALTEFASVICGEGCGRYPATMADALATGISIAGRDEAQEIAREAGVEAYLLILPGGEVVRGGKDPGRYLPAP